MSLLSAYEFEFAFTHVTVEAGITPSPSTSDSEEDHSEYILLHYQPFDIQNNLPHAD